MLDTSRPNSNSLSKSQPLSTSPGSFRLSSTAWYPSSERAFNPASKSPAKSSGAKGPRTGQRAAVRHSEAPTTYSGAPTTRFAAIRWRLGPSPLPLLCLLSGPLSPGVVKGDCNYQDAPLQDVLVV